MISIRKREQIARRHARHLAEAARIATEDARLAEALRYLRSLAEVAEGNGRLAYEVACLVESAAEITAAQFGRPTGRQGSQLGNRRARHAGELAGAERLAEALRYLRSMTSLADTDRRVAGDIPGIVEDCAAGITALYVRQVADAAEPAVLR